MVILFYILEQEMPEHDLEPPRFSRRALERLLNDWPAVRSMIMSGKYMCINSLFFNTVGKKIISH